MAKQDFRDNYIRMHTGKRNLSTEGAEQIELSKPFDCSTEGVQKLRERLAGKK